jgi:hypothetical protein
MHSKLTGDCLYYAFKSRKTGEWHISIGVKTFSIDKVPCYWWNKVAPLKPTQAIFATKTEVIDYIFAQINEEMAKLERNKDQICEYIRKECGEQ